MLPDRDPLRDWRFLVVYNVLRQEKEQTDILKEYGVGWTSFSGILEDLKSGKGLDFETDSDTANLVMLLDSDRDKS